MKSFPLRIFDFQKRNIYETCERMSWIGKSTSAISLKMPMYFDYFMVATYTNFICSTFQKWDFNTQKVFGCTEFDIGGVKYFGKLTWQQMKNRKIIVCLWSMVLIFYLFKLLNCRRSPISSCLFFHVSPNSRMLCWRKLVSVRDKLSYRTINKFLWKTRQILILVMISSL